MRIIAGTHRSRKILAPIGRGAEATTRPITDRVKQSLFDRLWSMGVLEAMQAWDLFSGTGSLGLEALSRGGAHCTFVERDRSACDLLRRNLEAFGLTDRATVTRGDVLGGGWLPRRTPAEIDSLHGSPGVRAAERQNDVSKRQTPAKSPGFSEAVSGSLTGVVPGVRVVFCDPPYRLSGEKAGMGRLMGLMEKARCSVGPGCVWVLRTDSTVSAGSARGWEGPDSHRYGSMSLHFYRTADTTRHG